MRYPRAIIQLVRVPEWAKNGFVAAPLLFAGRLGDLEAIWRTALAAVALCAISSAVYVANDILDAPRDRQHPIKRSRPVASGRISVPMAWALALGLVVAGAWLLALGHAGWRAWAMVGAFLALNIAYSAYLKQKVIVDVLTIAIGYVLRVLIGGVMIGVAVTHWLILCTFLLAAFLGFSKRRHELVLLGQESRHTRPVLTLYSEAFLDRLSMLTLAMTLTCYVLYTIAPETVAKLGTTALVYSSLIVMFALFRYLFLIHVKKLGSPVEVLYYDRQIVLAILCWILYVAAVVYTWPALQRLP